MKYFKFDDTSLKILGISSSILRDALRTHDYQSKAEKVFDALKGIETFLKKNPKIMCPYQDILESELAYLSKNEIAYIDGFTGKMKTIPFSKIKQASQKIKFNNPKRTTADFPESYEVINKAIGKISVNGKEAYSVILAIDHSLESTILRWLGQCSKFERMI